MADGSAFRNPEIRTGKACQGPETSHVAGLHCDDVPSRAGAGENMQFSGPVGLVLLTNYRNKRLQATFFQWLTAAKILHSETVK